jgi:hypothetical protein
MAALEYWRDFSLETIYQVSFGHIRYREALYKAYYLITKLINPYYNNKVGPTSLFYKLSAC